MPLGFKIALAVCIPLAIFSFYKLATMPHPKKTIHVNGQICDVVFVKTGQTCTSTGACSPKGYEEAVCPTPSRLCSRSP